jgi:hypothetical protein
MFLYKIYSIHLTKGKGYIHVFTIVYFTGHFKEIEISFCSCEKEVETLLRYDLWGSAPTSPRLAVSMDIMDMMMYLTLEAQVSSLAFCQMLKQWRDNNPVAMVCTLFTLLNY